MLVSPVSSGKLSHLHTLSQSCLQGWQKMLSTQEAIESQSSTSAPRTKNVSMCRLSTMPRKKMQRTDALGHDYQIHQRRQLRTVVLQRMSQTTETHPKSKSVNTRRAHECRAFNYVTACLLLLSRTAMLDWNEEPTITVCWRKKKNTYQNPV